MKELFLRLYNGDMSAREEIISNNMKLVYYLVHKSGFDNTEDNYQIGLVGLIRAVDTFDIYSSYSFSTYAAKCIKNELNMYYRSYYKEKAEYILDAPNYKTSNEPLIEYISDGIDITSNVDSKSFSEVLMRLVTSIDNERDKKILNLYLGLNGKNYRQKDIADIFGLDKSTVGRLIKKYLELFKIYVSELGTGDKPISIKERFKDYSSFKLRYLIRSLSDEDRSLALKRLDNADKSLSEEEILRLYKDILPEISNSFKNVNAEKKLFRRVKRDIVALISLMDIHRNQVKDIITDSSDYERKELLGLIGIGRAVLDSDNYTESSNKVIEYVKKEIDKNVLVTDDILYKCARIVQKGATSFIDSLIASGEDKNILETYYYDLKSKIDSGREASKANAIIGKSINSQIDFIDDYVVNKKVYERVLDFIESSKYKKLLEVLYTNELSIYVMLKGLCGKVYDKQDIAYYFGITVKEVDDTYAKVSKIVREYKLEDKTHVSVGFKKEYKNML